MAYKSKHPKISGSSCCGARIVFVSMIPTCSKCGRAIGQFDRSQPLGIKDQLEYDYRSEVRASTRSTIRGTP